MSCTNATETLGTSQEDHLGEYALGTLPPAQMEALDAHLRECESCARGLAEINEALALLPLGLPAQAPSPSVRTRLIASIAHQSRFDGFAARIGNLIDVAEEKARALLALIDDAAAWVVGPATARVIHLPHGPAVAEANVGFVRLAPGELFPEHEHRGSEHALILQGAFRDSAGNIKRAGDEHVMTEGSSHSFVALDGDDLIFLVVLHGGLAMRDGSSYDP